MTEPFMHALDSRTQFSELRAKRHSLRKTAEQLDVHRNTAFLWDQECRTEIQNLRSYEMEAAQEQYLLTYEEELLLLSQELNSINAELRKRDCRHEPTWLLVNRQCMLLARIDKLRLKSTPPPPPSQKPPTPKSE